MYFYKNFKKLKGDASSRIFYRKKKKNFSSIIVFSKKDKESNLLNYDAINKLLISNKILAPKLVSSHYSKNYIEIEDFGDQTVFDLFKKSSINKMKIYKKIINLLIKLQSIRQKKINNFKNKKYIISKYSSKILEKEAKLFTDWYLNGKLRNSEQKKFTKKYNIIIKKLIKKIYLNNDTFVHRDFHISNLMVVKKKIGIIDSQDALIGNKAYDLASLVDDVRLKTSEKLKKKIFNLYFKNQKKIDKKLFKNDFEIISVLRNLKIIGIFSRLAIRDNKKKYLKLIPYTWQLIKIRSKFNKNFKELNNLIKILNK